MRQAMLEWECDCGSYFWTSAKRGVCIKCPNCGATEDRQRYPGKDGMGAFEVVDYKWEENHEHPIQG